MRVEAFPGEHSPEASCLRLLADGKTLAFSGDTSDCPGVREACRGADLALIECSRSEPKTGHMTPDDCRSVIADAQPRRYLLTHLPPGLDTGDLPLAEDGMVVAL